jgi:hypothetical protein
MNDILLGVIAIVLGAALGDSIGLWIVAKMKDDPLHKYRDSKEGEEI